MDFKQQGCFLSMSIRSTHKGAVYLYAGPVAFALAFALLFVSLRPAGAVPASKPRITMQGERCVRIATAGVDHGEKTAQKYADELLAADLEEFRKKRGLKSLRIQRRFKKCREHLWFFGQEYNCTSLAVACW